MDKIREKFKKTAWGGGKDFSECEPGIKKTWDEMTEEQRMCCEHGCDFYIIRG